MPNSVIPHSAMSISAMSISATSISVLVVASDETSRWLLAELVAASPDLTLAATATALDAVTQARQQQPDLILLDCEYMTDTDPEKLLGKLALVSSATLVAISTKAWPGDIEPTPMMAAGASAVLPKPTGRTSITLRGPLAAAYAQSLVVTHRRTRVLAA